VPQIATAINTPLLVSGWSLLVLGHPDPCLVQFFLEGISHGFRIGFVPQKKSLRSARKNMDSAQEHPAVVHEYLAKEISSGRVIGPFPPTAVPMVHISRFGVIPKGHQPGKWRLIVDLSHPKSRSVNDGIPKSLCSLKYITVDDAIQEILQLGQGAHLAKVDIKSAFRLLPVHPADRHLLAMQWDRGVYIDTCLPLGLRSAPKLFDTMAELLAWILKQRAVTFLIHYLDDFLTVGPPAAPTCQRNLETIVSVCQLLGVPLALEKVEGPSTSLTFLGILLDTQKMEARLPPEKLET